jgi:small subunit ribosomal protein S14
MARLAKNATNDKRKKLVAKYAAVRAALTAVLRSPIATTEERDGARRKLQSLPRNSSKVRVRNRCAVTGRPRGYYRKFGLCRNVFRDLALRGDIPGVTKSSW